jgi:hypothetical protein
MAIGSYVDFEISFERAAIDSPDRFVARVRATGGSVASSTPFEIPISLADLAKLEDRMTRSTQRRGNATAGVSFTSDRKLARDLGDALFRSVFRDEVLRRFEEGLDTAHGRRAGLRLRLQFGAAPELIKLPWEFLYREATHDFLAMSPDIAIVRDVGLATDLALPALEGPLEILVVAADPSQDEELQIRREVDALRESVGELERRGEARLTVLEPSERESTWDALRHELSRKQQAGRGPYQFVHFIGHGAFDERERVGVLLFENDRRREHRVTGDDLATLLRGRGVRFVVINSCSGAVTSDDDAFSGVAQSLLRKGIPAVVAMQFEITDRAAIKFATAFYAGIADRMPVDEAMTEARLAILGFGNRLEWATPVLYMRPVDVATPSGEPDRRAATREDEARAGDGTEAERNEAERRTEREPGSDPRPLPVPWYATRAGRIGGGVAVAALVATLIGVDASRAPTTGVGAGPEATIEATASATAASTVATVPLPTPGRSALLASIVTVPDGAGRCPMPNARVRDDFESPNVAWKRTAQTVVAKGMMNVTPSNGYAMQTWRNTTVGDATICTTILNTANSAAATSAGSAAGIAFWWKKNTYDVFFISPTGTYHVSRFDDDRYTRIVKATASSLIRRDPAASNVLSVEMRGKVATLSINGTRVDRVTNATRSPSSLYYSGLVAETQEAKPVTWQFEYYGIGP